MEAEDYYEVGGETHNCEECGKALAEHQAQDSIHATHEIGGNDGRVLCRKHLDAHQRQGW